jgi:hypothetical protein
MITAIVKFLEAILSIAAALIVIGFAIAAFGAAYSNGSGGLLALIAGALGSFVGFIAAAIILGIPMLLLKINRNLESINSRLATQHTSNSTTSVRSEPRL